MTCPFCEHAEGIDINEIASKSPVYIPEYNYKQCPLCKRGWALTKEFARPASAESSPQG